MSSKLSFSLVKTTTNWMCIVHAKINTQMLASLVSS